MIPSLVADELRQSVVEFLATTFALSDADVHAALEEFLQHENDGIFREAVVAAFPRLGEPGDGGEVVGRLVGERRVLQVPQLVGRNRVTDGRVRAVDGLQRVSALLAGLDCELRRVGPRDDDVAVGIEEEDRVAIVVPHGGAADAPVEVGVGRLAAAGV